MRSRITYCIVNFRQGRNFCSVLYIMFFSPGQDVSAIRILSEHLANQIAAGEVVERPASVVKELVENSLDAGAGNIAVQVEGSGTRLIRVIDNGEGMDADDVLLSLERHATSKLNAGNGLEGITTLGFRGEALPSIASVARMILWSRRAEAATGTRAEIRYGVLRDVQEAGCAGGTMVEVRHLFGNVPARRKFLKSARTELQHIAEVLRGQALAHPGSAFTLRVEDRTVLNLPAGGNLETRVRDVYPGRDIWLRITRPAEGADDLGLEGFLLHSGSAGSDRLRILVNSRPVQDRMIRHAVMEGLRGFLMKGRSPAGVVLLTIPPEQIDVNVHPAKLEIRFRRARDVHGFIVQTITAALRKYQETVRSDLFAVSSPANMNRLSLPAVGTPLPAAPKPVQAPFSAFQGKGVTAEPPAGFRTEAERRDTAPLDRSGVVGQPPLDGLTLIGRLFDLYLLCEKEGEFVVIDQHAAHERILYQQLRTGYLQRRTARQDLMFPLSLELTPRLSEVVEAHGRDLEWLGFTIEHFGDETWVIKSVPALAGTVDPRELVVEAAEQLVEGSDGNRSDTVPERVERLLATMACRAAVKAGDSLAPQEVLELLTRMRGTDLFSHCPHGRPVFRRFSRREIARWFNRT
jgi:DNA mismatch repair protein MutL